MQSKEKIYKFLRWSEKYTQTDMVYLAQGGFWLTLKQIVTMLSGFILALIFANLVPREIYGTYKYILSLTGILAIPTLSGINTALVRAISKGAGGSFVPALKEKLKWGLCASGASLALAIYYFVQANYSLALALIIAAVFIPLTNAFRLYGAYWKGKQRFDIQTKYNLTAEIVFLFGLGLTLLVTQKLYLILLAYFGFSTISRFIFLSATLQKVKREKKQDPQTIPYGKHLSIMGLFYQISNNAANIILWSFLGASPIAIYSFAILVPQQIKNLFTNVFPIALPKFSEQPKEQIKKTLLKKIGKFYVLLIPLIIIYILIAPWIYRVFFPQYLDSIFYSRLFALTIIFIPQSLLALSLQAQMKKKMLYTLSIFSPIITISTLLIFVPLYGISGAIIASILAQSIGFGLNICLFKKM